MSPVSAVKQSEPSVPEPATKPELSTELDELGRAFRRVFRTLSRLRGRDTHLGGSEISHAQFELLIELYERGALPAGELAAAARLTPLFLFGQVEAGGNGRLPSDLAAPFEEHQVGQRLAVGRPLHVVVDVVPGA